MSSSVTKTKSPNAKPGAGRPKGSIGRRMKLIRAIAQNALRPGRTPLDTMLKNMYFYDDKASKLLEILEQKIGDKKVQPMELLELLKEMSSFRMSAQKCACDAAPFVHAKLSAIALKVDDSAVRRTMDETAMSDDELSDYYNNLRLRPTSVKPMEIILDNETGQQINEEDE